MTKIDILRDYVEKHKNLPTRTIARVILYEYGELWDGNLDRIRNAVSYYLGSHGDKHRKQRGDDLIKRTPLPETWRKVRNDYYVPIGKHLVLCDLHVPFHEITPIESAVSYGLKQKVTSFFLGGDAQDCMSLSFWPSTHKREYTRETDKFIDFLRWLKGKAGKRPIIYKLGNHEKRLPRYICSKAAELSGTPAEAMETYIDFEDLGIDIVDYDQKVMFGKLPFIHGHEIRSISRAVNPARGLFLKAKTWAACGHFHSSSEHTTRDINGKVITTWSIGCLCDLNPDYNPLGSDWNWGFAIIEVFKNGDFTVINKRILPSGDVV